MREPLRKGSLFGLIRVEVPGVRDCLVGRISGMQGGQKADRARKSAEQIPKPPFFGGRETLAFIGASSFTSRISDKVTVAKLSICLQQVRS